MRYEIGREGVLVKLVSVTKVRRSHSVCAQGGINIAVNLKGEDDSPIIHAYDTIKGGDFLANQPPILEMCLAGPGDFANDGSDRLSIQSDARGACRFSQIRRNALSSNCLLWRIYRPAIAVFAR